MHDTEIRQISVINEKETVVNIRVLRMKARYAF